MAARDFPRFPDLPTELRLQIWSHCIPAPRVVEIDFPVSDNHLSLPAGPLRALWSSPSGRAPLLSHVCREARRVALRGVQYVTTDAGQTDKDVLAIVEIRISAEEAAQAGVFGLLGEEPLRLVDPRDTATVVKFRDVWICRQSRSPSDEERDVAKFFSTAIDAADAYCARVEQWRQNLDKVWLWYKAYDPDIPWATVMESWPNWEDWDEGDSDGDEVEALCGWTVNWNRRELNRDRPRVQTQLALMPRFEPAIMFRHCVSSSGSCEKNIIAAATGATA